MATTKSDFGPLAKRKVTTYSKAAKSRQPKSPFTSSSDSKPAPKAASKSASTSTSNRTSTTATATASTSDSPFAFPDDDDDVPGSSALTRYMPSNSSKPRPKTKTVPKTQSRPPAAQPRPAREHPPSAASTPAIVTATTHSSAPSAGPARKRKVLHAGPSPVLETTARPRVARQKARPASPTTIQPSPRAGHASVAQASSRRRVKDALSDEDGDVEMIDTNFAKPSARSAKLAPTAVLPADQPTVGDDTPATSDQPRHHLSKPAQSHQEEMPVRLAPSSPHTISKPRSRDTATIARKPKRRLIDALVEQSQLDEQGPSNDDDDDDNDGIGGFRATRTPDPTTSLLASSGNNSLEPTPRPTDGPATPLAQSRTAKPRTFARAGSALKFTYGQGRKVLEQEEDDLFDSLALPQESAPSLKGRRLEFGRPSQLLASTGIGDDDDLDNTDSPKKKIRDIHELRQGGANSRVADEMQDLLDQIDRPTDKPTSARRGALLRVAENIHDRNFMRQCRDHGVEERLVQDIAQETDVVSIYLAFSSVLTILAKWPSAHFVRLLQSANVGHALAGLLRISDDIKKIARDRKTNLSKRNQAAMTAIEAKLLQIPAIWNAGAPKSLTPRALGIKCLHVLIEPDHTLTRDATVFPSSIADSLLVVLSDAKADAARVNFPHTDESLELFGAVSLFKYQALGTASTPIEKSEWSEEYLSAVADVFGVCSEHASPDNRALESGVLELTMNLANNNLAAPTVFIDKGLVSVIAGSICDSVGAVLACVSQTESLAEEVLNILILRLGVLINLSEHSSLVRQVVCDCQYGERWPIDDLLRLFLENYRRTAEADSVEQTRFNVAFGYLAVLLGYLCLYQPARKKFRSAHSSRSMGPLLDSIREFVRLMGTLESHLSEGDDGDEGQPNHAGLAKLEALAHQLEDEAAYD